MKRVVFTPELIVGGLRDAACLRILNAWRDGELKPVINRELALRYTRALRSAGLGPGQLKRWLWWFSAGDRSEFLAHIEVDDGDASTLCGQLALETEAECIVHSDAYSPPEGDLETPWLPASRIQL